MNVSLSRIEENFKLFEFQIKEENFNRKDKRFEFEDVACSIDLKKQKDKILVTGTYKTFLSGACDICRERAKKPFSGDLDLLLLPESDRMELTDDHELMINDVEVEYHNGNEVALADLVEDQIILDLPYSFRCSESCKGICIQCNTNLNLSRCDCHIDSGLNPFRVLKEML